MRRWEDSSVCLCKVFQKKHCNNKWETQNKRTEGVWNSSSKVSGSRTSIRTKDLRHWKKAPEAKTVKNARTRLRETTKASTVSRLIRKAREHGFRKTNSYSVGYTYFTTADGDGNPDDDNDEKLKRIQNRISGFVVYSTQYIHLVHVMVWEMQVLKRPLLWNH